MGGANNEQPVIGRPAGQMAGWRVRREEIDNIQCEGGEVCVVGNVITIFVYSDELFVIGHGKELAFARELSLRSSISSEKGKGDMTSLVPSKTSLLLWGIWYVMSHWKGLPNVASDGHIH
jgi:hypothetical protein